MRILNDQRRVPVGGVGGSRDAQNVIYQQASNASKRKMRKRGDPVSGTRNGENYFNIGRP